MKKILHISSDFLYTDVYNQLFNSLSDRTNEQLVYSAVKRRELGTTYETENYKTIISPILDVSDRLFFGKRIKKVFKDIVSKINVSNYDIIHAHFMFTDGGVALNLYKEYGIPYVIAIRNTDVNIYLKYFIHLRKLAFEILSHAKQVILISPSYKVKLKDYFSSSSYLFFEGKIDVIPNGIDLFWFNNQISRKEKRSLNDINFLFVGEITLNKNLEQTINLISSLPENFKVTFTVIGRKLDGFNQLSKLMKKYTWISYFDVTNDKNILQSYFQESDIFIMLSKLETFGLVYIESLSQGIPILYTKGQGIDGYFSEGSVGYNFDISQNSQEEFNNKVFMILNDYQRMSETGISQSTKFDWSMIADKYVSMYDYKSLNF